MISDSEGGDWEPPVIKGLTDIDGSNTLLIHEVDVVVEYQLTCLKYLIPVNDIFYSMYRHVS